MEELTVTLKTVTPLFLGGANPNESAELRASSIKGALRFWYRAIDPEYNKPFDGQKKSPTWEEKIFGSMGHGQGCFGIMLEENLNEENKWDPNDYKDLDEVHPKAPKNISEENKKEWTLNGVRYLSFSLKMGDTRRKYISSGKDVKLKFIFKPNVSDNCKKALIASIWLLSHVGGLGSRSRRGLGTVALMDWKLNNQPIPEGLSLPNTHNEKTIDSWIQKFKEGVIKIKKWYPEELNNAHTILSNNTKFYISSEGQKKFRKYFSWEMALFKAGIAMQSFRNRSSSDYENVKNHLAKKEKIYRANQKSPQELPLEPKVNPIKLSNAPERCFFGLPLTFQYSSLDKAGYKNKKAIFQGESHERSASPLFIRIVEIDGKCYPFFTLLDAPLLAPEEKVNAEINKNVKDLIEIKPSNILNDFCTYLTKNNYMEINCE